MERYRAAYAFNLVGKRLSINEKLTLPDDTISQRLLSYEYDSLYQLLAEDIYETSGTASRRAYTYDGRGNRLSMSHTANGAQTITAYTYNGADQLLSETTDALTVSYEYDNDGNRVKKIAPLKTAVYDWDAAGRLVEVDTDNNGTPEFKAKYDYRMRRHEKQERDSGGLLQKTRFRYDGGVAYDEVDKDGNMLAEFTRGKDLGGGVASILNASRAAKNSKPAREEYYIYNAVGHSVLLVDGGCAPVQVNLYEAFGGIERTWGDSDNNRLANTKERDVSIGLDNHGFRYFDPKIGRYISNDPIAYEGGMNLYAYVGNDPVNSFDPHGLKKKEQKELEEINRKIREENESIKKKLDKLKELKQDVKANKKEIKALEKSVKSEYKTYLGDLGKSGKLAKAYLDSNWLNLSGDYELAGEHMQYGMTFDDLPTDRSDERAIARSRNDGFGEALESAATRTAATYYGVKGLEYAGDGAGIALGGGVLLTAGKQVAKLGLKEGGKEAARLVANFARDELKDSAVDTALQAAGIPPEALTAIQMARGSKTKGQGSNSTSAAKKVPNPDGKKGSDRHQAYVEDEYRTMDKKYNNHPDIDVSIEAPVRGADGKLRYVDVQARNVHTGQVVDQVQVGRTNKSGTPVARERAAMEDIDRATGFDTRYRSYDR